MEKKYSSSKSGQVSSTPSTPTKRKQRADESEDHPKIHIKSASLKKNKDISPEHEMNPGWCSSESFGVDNWACGEVMQAELRAPSLILLSGACRIASPIVLLLHYVSVHLTPTLLEHLGCTAE